MPSDLGNYHRAFWVSQYFQKSCFPTMAYCIFCDMSQFTTPPPLPPHPHPLSGAQIRSIPALWEGDDHKYHLITTQPFGPAAHKGLKTALFLCTKLRQGYKVGKGLRANQGTVTSATTSVPTSPPQIGKEIPTKQRNKLVDDFSANLELGPRPQTHLPFGCCAVRGLCKLKIFTVISWWVLDGCSYLLMVNAISWWVLDGCCYFLMGSGW